MFLFVFFCGGQTVFVKSSPKNHLIMHVVLKNGSLKLGRWMSEVSITSCDPPKSPSKMICLARSGMEAIILRATSAWEEAANPVDGVISGELKELEF